MTATQTAKAPTTPAVIVTGNICTPLTYIRLLPNRVARVSFRVDGPDGPFNVHAGGLRAELLHATLHKGDRVTVHAPGATLAHPCQTIPDLEADSVELDLH
ncbi:hypothetical protein ACPW96_21615 [Micromonospora sp. DT81.3]|uniref:hypothetical protein n=1 Tax=Micromonospora sp. DT81.3 TaxID=3416523 RepID=UPI003CEAC674